MMEWWRGLETVTQWFYGAATFFSAIFLWQFITSLIGLGGAEDVGDYFKFRLSWESTHAGEVVPATSHAVDVEQIVLVGRNAAHDQYELMFVIDWDADGVGNEIRNHDLLGATLYRVDATNPDVTNEINVLDYHLHYPVNKMFAAA